LGEGPRANGAVDGTNNLFFCFVKGNKIGTNNFFLVLSKDIRLEQTTETIVLSFLLRDHYHLLKELEV